MLLWYWTAWAPALLGLEMPSKSWDIYLNLLSNNLIEMRPCKKAAVFIVKRQWVSSDLFVQASVYLPVCRGFFGGGSLLLKQEKSGAILISSLERWTMKNGFIEVWLRTWLKFWLSLTVGNVFYYFLGFNLTNLSKQIYKLSPFAFVREAVLKLILNFCHRKLSCWSCSV